MCAVSNSAGVRTSRIRRGACVAVPRLKWLAAAIGAGLTYAAVSNTCAMATALLKLPYNRGAASDAKTVLAQLDTLASADSATVRER
jgi:hypothetical protein